MTRDEACRENWTRWQREPEVFAAMMHGMSSAPLRRIDILGDRNSHAHDGIRKDQDYLFCTDGRWHIGRASKSGDGKGWEFRHGGTYSSLRELDILFEIYLPEVPKNPLGRIPVPQDECDDDELNEWEHR